jgi:chromosome segregation ATPase
LSNPQQGEVKDSESRNALITSNGQSNGLNGKKQNGLGNGSAALGALQLTKGSLPELPPQDDKEKRLQPLMNELTMLDKRIDPNLDIFQQARLMKEKRKQAEAERNASLEKDKQALAAEVQKLKTDLQKLGGDNQGLQNQIANTKADNQKLTESITTLSNEKQQLLAEIANLKNEKQGLGADNKALTGENDKLKSEKESLLKQIHSLSADLNEALHTRDQDVNNIHGWKQRYDDLVAALGEPGKLVVEMRKRHEAIIANLLSLLED